jgi:hypothetical protein
MREDALDRFALSDDGDDAQPAVALRAFENVDRETAPEQ